MTLKQCSKCKEPKPLKDFYKDKSTKDGKDYQCKECKKKYHKKYRQVPANRRKATERTKKWYRIPANKRRATEYHKKRYQIPANKKAKVEYDKKRYQVPTNKRRVTERAKKWYQIPANKKAKVEYDKKYRQTSKYKKWRNQNAKKQYNTNSQFRLNSIISKAIWQVKNSSIKQGRSWKKLLPYTLIQLEKHLKKTLPDGYTWKDFMQGKLHIDHIHPKAIFQFEKPEDLGFQRCWALDNLRLLPAKANLRKHTKLLTPFQQNFPVNIKIRSTKKEGEKQVQGGKDEKKGS